jgi:hypothetical protein
MYGIKSREGRWSVSLCDCSEDTAHVHYGNVVIHVLREDLRDLGLALQNVAEGSEHLVHENVGELKKGSVQ